MRSFAPIAVAVAVATFAFAPAATADIECDGMQRSFTG